MLREARGVLGRWLHGSEAEDRSAALVLLTFAPQHDGWLAPQPDVLGRLRETALALRRDFGRVDPAWGEVLRLRRGRLDLGLGGAPDVANAIYHRPARDGRREAVIVMNHHGLSLADPGSRRFLMNAMEEFLFGGAQGGARQDRPPGS